MAFRKIAGSAVRGAVELALRAAERGHDPEPDALLDALAVPPEEPEAAENLARLLRACHAEAGLSAFGRRALFWDLHQRVANLRALRAAETETPAILRERIRSPLIITGMPRSGTTFLHRLLAADPAAFVPHGWETLHPYPEPGRPDHRARDLERQLKLFAIFAPELVRMHPVRASTPQECTELTAGIFRSLRFETMYAIPSYKSWLAAAGHGPAYQFHRRFLQHLQHQHARDGHWVLKCPDHVFALAELRATYPDARLVFLHRDPVHVLGSVARLTEALRVPFARDVDRPAIGRQILEDWARGGDILALEATQPGQALHLRFREIVTRPLETVRRIYGHFGMRWTEAAAAPIARLAAAMPDGGYGEYAYDFSDYGITTEEVRLRFADYMRALDLPLEGPSLRPRLRQAGLRPAPAGAGRSQTPLLFRKS